ncbi:MAG: PTS sugar transporter subunit IIA [Candidatus Omnitrophica bacterium]|nr:PTS sugar transporter subunit IIA [Candidatus Omnitrophota bacterium]MBU4302844.1 PTS sugar transporter subunit IIA [Candidatus Omnitrophota bacterium]MBU4468719.1 PTS sugar transporter subunit IIA [Candidatus Omnitrophota bacterium]MCG2707738.1 PTS sugar transporter subunit IIA [Candidatus Omnitrophota bacterium]
MGAVFKYRARDSNGMRRDGEIEAISQDEAVKKLQSQGLTVIYCEITDSLSKGKTFLSRFKRNLLLIKGLLFPINCFKCKKELVQFTIKKIVENKFICNSCLEALRTENQKIIFEIIGKYVSGKDNNFREGIKVLCNSISAIGLEPHSLSRGKNALQIGLENLKTKRGNREVGDIIYKKNLTENSLIFLDDLEKMQKLLKNKGIEIDYLAILATFIEFMDIEYIKSIENLSLDTYNIIVKEFGKNVTKQDVIELFIKTNLKFDSDAESAMFYKTLDKLNFAYTKNEIADLIKEAREKIEIEEFEQNLGIQQQEIGIGDFRNLRGHEFEEYVQKLFELLGYATIRMPLTGDQGADLIISREGIKTAVQIKKYDGSVSNKAIQEVVAAKTYYKADKAMVVTNSSFTSGAIDLALANDVELWDGQKLERTINDLKKTKRPRSVFDFKKALEAVPGVLISSEELEIFKTVMIHFLDSSLNLDSLIFPELTKDFLEKMDKLRSSNAYSDVVEFAKKPIINSTKFRENLSRLQEILDNKGFHFGIQELSKTMSLEKDKQDDAIFKKIMISYPVNNLREFLENFVILYNQDISVLRDFRKAYEIIIQIGFSQKKAWLDKLKNEGIDIENLENAMSYTIDMEMNFDSEVNARQFMLGIAGEMIDLLTYLKKLLSENKIELRTEEGVQLSSRELIEIILSIRPADIKNYDEKRSALCEFKIFSAAFSLDLINSNLKSKNKENVLREIASLFTKSKRVKNGDEYYQNILESEKILNTAFGQNIAIPNALSDVSENMCIAIGISREGVDFNSPDGSLVKIIFMVAWNDEIFGNMPGPRLKLLARISKFLRDQTIRESLINSRSDKEIFQFIKEKFNNYSLENE